MSSEGKNCGSLQELEELKFNKYEKQQQREDCEMNNNTFKH